jgi:alpha-L-fucosidase
MLVDIVSKNGNLLLNVVQTPEGDLEPDMLKILDEIGIWTSANGEGIYGSRPWKIYGEKPADKPVKKQGQFDENFGFSSKDIRFTTKGSSLYVYCLGKPEADIAIKSLGKSSKLADKLIASVTMVGSKEELSWKQNADALVIKKPANLPSWQVTGFKIEFRK